MSEETTSLLSEGVESGHSGGTEQSHNTNSTAGSNDQVEVRTGCWAKFGDPQHLAHRILVLFPMCFITFGSYFCYDNPGSLQQYIKTELDVNSTQFMLLYALYSYPNFVLCIFGGYLIDRYLGVRRGANIFAFIVCIGQGLFATGAFFGWFWLMEVARFIYGLGGESLTVAQNAYIVTWFKGKELSFVMGLSLCFGRLGSSVSFQGMAPMYMAMSEKYGSGTKTLGICLFIAGTLCIFSFGNSLLMGYLDKRRERILRIAGSSANKMKFSEIKNFPSTFWLLSGVCVTYYVTIFPFVDLGAVYYSSKYGYSPSAAGTAIGVVYWISIGLCPFVGAMIDYFGRNVFWLFSGIVVTIVSYVMLAFTTMNVYYATVSLGIGFSIVSSALWPMVAILIAENKTGTAYGIMQALQNLGLAIVSQTAGVIVDEKGYVFCIVYFLLWLGAALAICIVAYFVDKIKFDGELNLSRKQRTEGRPLPVVHEVSVN